MLLSSGIDPQQRVLWQGGSRGTTAVVFLGNCCSDSSKTANYLDITGETQAGSGLEGWTCHRPVSLSGVRAPKNNARMIAIPSVAAPRGEQ
jgi:hypothetical protein